MVTPLRSIFKRTATLCLLASLPFALMTTEVAATDFDKPVFEFQSKLANKGNAKAQYFLAQMYEEGRGTMADAEMAKHWYEQAKLNGYVADVQIATSN